MSPTIVLKDGKPFLALGSPGGATIITTVLQVLVNRIDLGMTLPEAMAAPRASQRNTAAVQAEPAFIAQYGGDLDDLGHTFTPVAELGAATAIEFGRGGRMIASAEPARRGSGAAGVVHPRR
jgi:gamma-glutamyltranspeptidase/glutathione hydrolase